MLDAALRLIARDGYAAGTMEAIAREARIAKPVVYDLFGTRAQLLQALLEREERRALAELRVALPEPPLASDWETTIIEGIQVLVRAVRAHPDSWRLILTPVEGTPDVVQEHRDRGRRLTRRRTEAVLAWAVERGELPADLDVELGAHAVVALAEHSARLVLTAPGQFTPERIGSFLSRILGFQEQRAA